MIYYVSYKIDKRIFGHSSKWNLSVFFLTTIKVTKVCLALAKDRSPPNFLSIYTTQSSCIGTMVSPRRNLSVPLHQLRCHCFSSFSPTHGVIKNQTNTRSMICNNHVCLSILWRASSPSWISRLTMTPHFGFYKPFTLNNSAHLVVWVKLLGSSVQDKHPCRRVR